MKEKKNNWILKLVIATAILVLSANVVLSETTDLVTIKYLGNEMASIPGNASLVFVNSTMDNHENDVVILWRIYTPSNMTIYSLGSKAIQYDSNFVNNTKTYLFRDNSTNKFYKVFIDYSSIQVPRDPEDILQEIIALKNATINNLTIQVNALNESVANLTVSSNMYKDAWQMQKDENVPLRQNISNMAILINSYRNETTDLRLDVYFRDINITSLEGTIDQLRNNWVLGYSYHGKDYGPYFNYTSLALGLIIGIIGVVIISKKITGGLKKKNAKKNATSDIEKPRQHSIIGSLLRTDYGVNKRQDIPFGSPKSFTGIDEKPQEQLKQPELKTDYKDISSEVDRMLNERKDNDRSIA